MHQNVSISTQPMLMVAALLFVSFLGGALIIHARNQAGLFDGAAPRSLAWARCSRRLYWSALWAALALIAPMIMQFVALLQARGPLSSTYHDTAFFIGFISLAAEASAIVISIVIALNAATDLLSRFGEDNALLEPPAKNEQAQTNR